MKKVFLAVLALALAATPAFAVGGTSILKSKHDLSSSNTGYLRHTTIDQICVFCHTPHFARTDLAGIAPLWNRSKDATLTVSNVYNSATIESATKKLFTDYGAGGAAAFDTVFGKTDVPLCLSCHDGTVTGANDNLVNPPNGFESINDATTENQGMSTTGTGAFSASTQIATDGLGNDHPIGMNYVSVYNDEQNSGDKGIWSLAYATNRGVAFYGNSRQDMWCSSCHDVHTPGTSTTGTYPFLITTNSASYMCLSCHNK